VADDPTTDAILAMIAEHKRIVAEHKRMRAELVSFNNESYRIHGLLDDMGAPKEDLDVHATSRIENRLRKMSVAIEKRPAPPKADGVVARIPGAERFIDGLDASHHIVFRADQETGLHVTGCTCGFRATGQDPDTEMSLHLADWRAAIAVEATTAVTDPTYPARVAYDHVQRVFGDGGTPDERRELYWRTLNEQQIRAKLDAKMEAVKVAKEKISKPLGQLHVTVSKPWGQEKIWAHTDKYVGKILTIEPGQTLSLQYHRDKDETIFVLTGSLLFTYGTVGNLKSRTVGPGEPVHIPPGLVHRMHATDRTTVLEVSTPELDDVVRLEDRYGRAGQ
jgi:mannose-6-phosphate isomerase